MSIEITGFKVQKPVCENCQHFKLWEKQGDPRMSVGDCRLNEPGNFQVGENKFMTKWPSVKTTDFCGKFSANFRKPTTIEKPV